MKRKTLKYVVSIFATILLSCTLSEMSTSADNDDCKYTAAGYTFFCDSRVNGECMTVFHDNELTVCIGKLCKRASEIQ